MIRRPLKLLSVLSLLVCVAAVALWVRAGAAGDYAGWKRQRAEGPNWVQEEWSLRSHAGQVQFLSSRRTTGASGQTAVKAQIRKSEEGYFWTPAVETKPAKPAETIEIQKTGAKPATAPTTAPADPLAAAAGRAFTCIDENTPAYRVRGAVVSHWLLVAASGALPFLWFAGRVLRGGKGADAHDDGPSDRVALSSRLSGTFASLSILMSFALGFAWLKSWYVGDRISWRDTGHPQFVDVHSGRGELVVHYRRVDPKLLHTAPDLSGAPNGFNWRQDNDAGVGYTAKTFCFEHENQSTAEGASRTITLAAPYWALVVLALVPPSWWLRNQKYGPIKPMSFGRANRETKITKIGFIPPINQRPM